MAKKIAFINNKGGSAKTTTAVNIAGAYAMKYPERKILIVESDGQGNATRSFNLKAKQYEKTMYDVFMGNNTPEECVVNAYQNIDIIPANNDMNFVEFDEMSRYEENIHESIYETIKRLGSKNIEDISYPDFKELVSSEGLITDNYFDMLNGKLDSIDKLYDLIVFDTPPEIKAITSSILAVTDEVVIPFEPDTYSIDGVVNILSRIKTIQKQINPKLSIAGVLAVKVKNNTILHNDIINRMMKYCMRTGLNYFQTEIPNSIRFASSTSYKGLPATITQSDNPFVQSYYNLLSELEENDIL